MTRTHTVQTYTSHTGPVLQTHHVTNTHKCLDCLNYGRNEDSAKSTYSIMALIARGLGAKRVHAKAR